MAPFWASLAHSGGKVRNCVWTKQILWSLVWLREFILENRGVITRVFEYDAYFAAYDNIVITCDASPFGIGAWLTINWRLVSWFADQLTSDDALFLNRDRFRTLDSKLSKHLSF